MAYTYSYKLVKILGGLKAYLMILYWMIYA